MASSKEFLEFILEQLSMVSGITYRAMMGEYIIYFKGRVVGGIYDDRLLLKPTPALKELMPKAEYALPYEGGKPMILVENVDDRDFLAEIFDRLINFD